MNGTKNSDGTYTCTVNKKGKVKGYTARTAPSGSASRSSSTTYQTAKDYIAALNQSTKWLK